MAEPVHLTSTRCPPSRQVRGTKLNTIIEDSREAQFTDNIDSKTTTEANPTNQPNPTNKHPPLTQLKLKTTGLPPSSRLNRFMSPMSAGSISSCSDTEWQRQMQGFDDLYDATDESESEMSDDCTSFASTRPNSLETPITRVSSVSPVTRKRYPSLTIPSSTTWSSIHDAPKSSPVPPTPPQKIPVSSTALSMLGHSVPAVHAPPSLDGSVSSDQVSAISAPATPDLQSLPDTDWNARDIHVRRALEDGQNSEISDGDGASETQDIEISIDNAEEDWRNVLLSFPSIPGHTAPQGSENEGPSRENTPSDNGVFLPEGAMATLRHIPLNGTPDSWSETSDKGEEMWQIHTPPERPRSAGDATPASALSAYSFSAMSIPSPGGFFASLGPRARHTWSIPKGNRPPSSAVAENFYSLPFSRHDQGEIVEQVIDCPDLTTDEELTAKYDPNGPPTAIRIPPTDESQPKENSDSPLSPLPDVVEEISRPASSFDDQDETYMEDLKNRAMASLDRTSVWLAAQQSYLSVLSDTNPVNFNEEPNYEVAGDDEASRKVSSELIRKKSVRFAENLPVAPSEGPSALASKDSIYWRGFQSLRQLSTVSDTFLHRNTRFDALQSIRLGLVDTHVDCLLGHYELARPDRPAYRGPFSQAPRNSVVVSAVTERVQFNMLEKEQYVVAQLHQSMWAMDALRYLNGGKLLSSPASQRLSKFNTIAKKGKTGKPRSFRVLDLGGHASCEWAWDFAYDNPNAKVYTVFTEPQSVNLGIKGPENHRHISVSQLWKLPFPDNKFDVISARSLPALLKMERPVGEYQDEYDLCLQECLRCLKPGGYLEYFVMDAAISHAGPYASASSVEFSFNLKTRGYDPTPTKSFLARLRKSNFEEIKRAWMFLPMGVEPSKPSIPRETPEPRVKSQIDYEAVQGPVGSTADAASVSGIYGGWMWEQWLLKLQMEMGRERSRLLDGVGAVFDEGRKNGAGWTCLTGWAMKPRRRH